MNIYVKNTEEQYLVVEFTEEELSNELLPKTINNILGKYDGEQIDNTLHITPHHDQKMGNIGLLVDEIREQLMGDVVQEFEEQIVEVEPAILDMKGKITKPSITRVEMVPIEKDLSGCPCLSFTQQNVEPIKKENEEEPIKEDVIKEGGVELVVEDKMGE